jgi:hypothetical protein
LKEKENSSLASNSRPV